jgi:hypothetical protein
VEGFIYFLKGALLDSAPADLAGKRGQSQQVQKEVEENILILS